ncbi:MAG: hypothetical protein ABJZ55_15310 [Fuerstiella sp.]
MLTSDKLDDGSNREQRASKLPWQMRSDLVISAGSAARQNWIIKDPLRLSYFSIEAEEYAFLRLLDGNSTLPSIKDELIQQFPGVEFSDQNLMMFLASSAKSGLLIPTSVGYGEVLARKHDAEVHSAKVTKLFSLISHRFRGIDPTPILRPLNRLLGWVFHHFVQWATMIFIATVAMLVLSRWSQLMSEIPTLAELFTPGNLIIISCSVAAIKVLHELGHALTCYHYGGECHELGVIFIGFLPLLYCDVSDSWLQQNSSRRIQVAGAGIVVELILAAVCGLLWMVSVPGALHSFFLNIMLLCSFNTLLVNGNPLLKYDGYYVLSDLLRIPNLGPQSRSDAISFLDRLILGVPADHDHRDSGLRRIAMPIWGVASFVYRLIVLVSILFFINAACRPFRLEAISYVLAASAFAGLFFPFTRFVKQRWMVMRNSTGPNLRAMGGVIGTGFLLLIAVLFPLPFSINAASTLSPGVSAPIYVQTAGHVQTNAAYGSLVETGELVATLRNHEIDSTQTRLQGEVAVAESRVYQLTSNRQFVAGSAALPSAKKAVINAQDRLATVDTKAARLLLRSPRDGVIRPPRSRIQPVGQKFQQQQQFWTGTPLDKKNVNTWLDEQTIVAWIGEDQDLRVLCYVAERDIEFVSQGAVAEVTFDSSPGDVISGQVTRLTKTAETKVPQELSAKGFLAVGSEGAPLTTVFAVYVRIDSDQVTGLPPLYSTGQVSIVCQPRSLSQRTWRLLRHTFAFDI